MLALYNFQEKAAPELATQEEQQNIGTSSSNIDSLPQQAQVRWNSCTTAMYIGILLWLFCECMYIIQVQSVLGSLRNWAMIPPLAKCPALKFIQVASFVGGSHSSDFNYKLIINHFLLSPEYTFLKNSAFNINGWLSFLWYSVRKQKEDYSSLYTVFFFWVSCL